MTNLLAKWNRLFLLLIISLVGVIDTHCQCDQNYDWAVWDNFLGNSATGTITQNGQVISVEMTANYNFDSTPSIYTFSAFSGFDGDVPNTTVPRTTWAVGTGGTTTMCFSEVVSNPVLLLASLGSPGTPVTLELSLPYTQIYDGGGMTFINSNTIIGEEGFTVLLFSGNFQCITIFSSTAEFYTNITWGLNPPLFQVAIDGDSISCDSVVLTASGGEEYEWSGGISPNTASNTFIESGNYFVTVTDSIGCEVVTSVNVQIDTSCIDCNGVLNGSAVIDECGECLEPTDPEFNQSCIDCNGVPNGGAIIDECGECLEPTDSNFNQSCIDCRGVKDGNYVIDECGECLEPTDPYFNQSCIDCNGVPNGKSEIDICGKCLEPTDPGYNQSCADEYELIIPNIFSPNDDGINDVFEITKISQAEAILKRYQIFDRWGNLLYELNNVQFNTTYRWWNGKFNGQKVRPGVYVYYIEIEFPNGDRKQYTGDITLVN